MERHDGAAGPERWHGLQHGRATDRAVAHGHTHGLACDRASTHGRPCVVGISRFIAGFQLISGIPLVGVSKAPQLGFLFPSLKPH